MALTADLGLEVPVEPGYIPDHHSTVVKIVHGGDILYVGDAMLEVGRVGRFGLDLSINGAPFAWLAHEGGWNLPLLDATIRSRSIGVGKAALAISAPPEVRVQYGPYGAERGIFYDPD